MKLVIAYIQPDQIEAVTHSLHDREIFKVSATHAFGCGSERAPEPPPAGAVPAEFLPRVRLEIAVNEPYVRPTVQAIVRGAQTGEVGDGKIFVIDLQECIRIRDGEAGMEAIG